MLFLPPPLLLPSPSLHPIPPSLPTRIPTPNATSHPKCHFPLPPPPPPDDGRSISIRTKIWAFCVRLLSHHESSMFGCQSILPSQPLPRLHCTMERLVSSMRTLYGADSPEYEFYSTEAEVSGVYGLCGTLWSSAGLYGALRDSMELCGTLWALRDFMELCGTLWSSAGLYGSLRDSMGSAGLYGALRDFLELCGTLWSSAGLYGTLGITATPRSVGIVA